MLQANSEITEIMYLADITENETESSAILLNVVRGIMSKPELKPPRLSSDSSLALV